MKAIVADIYTFYIHNSRNTMFPKRFQNYKIIWSMREALLALWEGSITHLAIPELGTPGYDFPDFVDKLIESGQLKEKPKFEYYQLNITRKS
jgi:hypothetical protein